MFDWDTWGPVTVVVVVVTVLYAIVGAVLVIADHSLDFEEYGRILAAFMVANGLLGVGRGLRLHNESITRRPSKRRS